MEEPLNKHNPIGISFTVFSGFSKYPFGKVAETGATYILFLAV